MSTEERMQILRMVESKQITAEEAAKLLSAMDTAESNQARPGTQPANGYRSRWLRIRVTDGKGRQKVNVNVPYSLVEVAARFGVKFIPRDVDLGGVNAQDILAAIRSGVQGKLVEVENEDSGEHVEIFIE